MDFPGAEDLADVLEGGELPPLARVDYEPATPTVADVPGRTRDVVAALADRLPPAGTVAVGVGSRGIDDLFPVTEAVVAGLRERGLEPVLVPAMGSHGGATAAGQQAVLEGLGLSASDLGCPIDARMETEEIDHRTVNGHDLPIHFATAALEADAVLPINRIKPHTDFSGTVESGVCKMLAVGFGKQPGARAVHRHAKRDGYVPALRAAIDAITARVDVVGGVGLIENFHDETGEITAVRPPGLIEAEAPLLERAKRWMPTLPVEDIDLLIVDEIGKDVSGTGMDTNVIGRSGGAGFETAPAIEMVYARALTPGSKGNANGIGLADVVNQRVLAGIDPVATYTNALTSGNLNKVAVPIALPSDRLGIQAALTGLGTPPVSDLRVVWIQNTGELGSFRLSPAVLATAADQPLAVTGWEEVQFTEGELGTRPTDPPAEATVGNID